MSADYAFGDPKEVEEAIERNKKIALEQGVSIKPSNSIAVEDFTKKISKDSSREDKLWKIIFDLIEEIKILKEKKSD